MRLTLLHREGCGLCEEMLAELETLKSTRTLPPIDLVEVDRDAELNRRYGLNIPVLLLDGTFVCRHHLDPEELARLLRARTLRAPPSV